MAAWIWQRRLIYYPDPAHIAPHEVGLIGVDEVVLPTSDGECLICWLARARPGQPTLLYCHGNGASLAWRAERIRAFQRRGIGVFLLSYRGYGGSTGSPSEAANVADAASAYDALVSRGVAAADIVLYGESLGSGVAV